MNEPLITCRINLYGRVVMELPFFLFGALAVLELTVWNSNNPADAARNTGLIFLLLILLLFWIIVHYGIIPHYHFFIDNTGMHGIFRIKIGTHMLFERLRTIRWDDVEKFEWFNSGYLIGYLAWGKNEFGKYGGMGPTIFSTNIMCAVQCIVDQVLISKIDLIILKKLKKYQEKQARKRIQT